jgi:hypothetical protein
MIDVLFLAKSMVVLAFHSRFGGRFLGAFLLRRSFLLVKWSHVAFFPLQPHNLVILDPCQFSSVFFFD